MANALTVLFASANPKPRAPTVDVASCANFWATVLSTLFFCEADTIWLLVCRISQRLFAVNFPVNIHCILHK